MNSEKPPRPDDRSQAASSVKDALGGVVATAVAAVAMSTGVFVTNGMSAILYELEAANMAQKRARREDVKTFAERMRYDFEKMKSELGSFLAGTPKPTEPPTEPMKLHQVLLDDLAGSSDEDFDRRYVTQQRLAHLEAITLFKTFHKFGDNDGLKNLCRLGLPVLEKHADAASQLQAAMKRDRDDEED